jgi:hypothetical protein
LEQAISSVSPSLRRSTNPLLLHSMEHPLTQQRKACPAISLSFDQFQLGHLSFHQVIVDPAGESSSHGVFVFLNPSSKGLEFGKFAAFYLCQPGIEMFSCACGQHLDELLNQVISQIDFWVDLTKLDQCLLFLNTQSFRATKKSESRSCSDRSSGWMWPNERSGTTSFERDSSLRIPWAEPVIQANGQLNVYFIPPQLHLR